MLGSFHSHGALAEIRSNLARLRLVVLTPSKRSNYRQKNRLPRGSPFFVYNGAGDGLVSETNIACLHEGLLELELEGQGVYLRQLLIFA